MQKFQCKLRSEKGATEIAQFPLTIYCLFLVVLLPVLNLVTLLVAGATAYLATNDLAAKAATQSTFAQSLNAMVAEAYSFQSNSLAQFVKMVPHGGYTGCGNDLYVLATNIGGSGVQSSAADQSLNSNIDTTKNIYEMQVVSSYTVAPLVSLAPFPLLGSIPGLGQPVILSFAASRPIEHPGGMQTVANGGGTATVTPFNRIGATAPGVMPPATAVTWRNPNIYQQIQNAGETVVAVAVVIVPANAGVTVPAIVSASNATSTGLTITTGEKIWVDTTAVGLWSAGPTCPTTDANGVSQTIGGFSPLHMQQALLGIASSTGTPFFLGDDQYNYSLGTGQFSMIFNDATNGYWNNTGSQMVRVIVVR